MLVLAQVRVKMRVGISDAVSQQSVPAIKALLGEVLIPELDRRVIQTEEQCRKLPPGHSQPILHVAGLFRELCRKSISGREDDFTVSHQIDCLVRHWPDRCRGWSRKSGRA